MSPLRPFLLAVLACGAILVSTPASGQRAPPQPLNPKTYVSPSGRYALLVDPTERFGSGPGHYRMTDTEKGTVVWAGERAFTLHDALVADDGAVAGYGYTLGEEGQDYEHLGEMLVTFLDLKGQVRRQERNAREMSMVLHGGPLPTASGLFLDAPRDRLLVRFAPGVWWVYRYADGKRLGETDVSKLVREGDMRSGALYPEGERSVPGTGLMMVRWRRYRDQGALFALVDPMPPGQVIWSLEVPRELPPKDQRDEDAPDPMLDAIVPTDAPAAFALWLAEKGERVDYAVEPKPAGEDKAVWKVREVRRQPAPAPAPDFQEEALPGPPEPALPEGNLKALGTFRLRDAAPGSLPAVRGVGEFGFDGQGRIGFLRGEGDHLSFVLVEPEHGTPVHEIDLRAITQGEGEIHLVWIGPADRWLLTCNPSDKGKTAGWILDAAGGTFATLENFDCPPIESLAGAGDGRFFVLRHLQTQLIGFGPDGRRTWIVDEDYDTMFSPDDVTVLDDAETGGKVLAVVETVGHHVDFFEAANGHLRSRLDLEKAWGREPNYPCRICPDEAGGFVVEDFHGKVPYVRMTVAGEVRGPLEPRPVDGGPWQGSTLRHSPVSGRFWSTDGNALLRLDAEGKVDLTLGEGTGGDRLGNIAAITVDDAGLVYAAEARSGNVHVFDPAGAPLRVLRLGPEDRSTDGNLFDVAVASDGHVFVGGDSDGDGQRRVEFAPDGRRVGQRQLPVTKDSAWRTCHFRPSSDPRAVLLPGPEDFVLTSLDEKAQAAARTVARQPDGVWLNWPRTVSFAPDGGFALTDHPSERREDWTVNLYAANGNGRRVVSLPKTFQAGRLAYNGRNFATDAGERLAVFDADTGEGVLAFIPVLPGDLSLARGEWQFFSVRGGRELWLVESSSRTVARFAWPEVKR